jgi:Flp pilus assembly protein TadB
MTAALVSVIIGLAGGAAAVFLLVALLPPAPVDLHAAITQADRMAAGSPQAGTTWSRFVDDLVARSSRSEDRWWGVPTSDLDLLDRGVRRYVVDRLAYALAGVVVLGVAAAVAGVDLAVIVAVMMLGAVCGSLVPVTRTQSAATRARDEFARAVTSYMDLVAQTRAAGAAPSQALTDAASISQGQAFRRIRAVLSQSTRTGVTPWEALAELGRRLRVPELEALADIASSAADGAAVYTTLTSKAAALRNTALNTDRELANRRSEHLVGPLACQLAGIMILVIYPVLTRF